MNHPRAPQHLVALVSWAIACVLAAISAGCATGGSSEAGGPEDSTVGDSVVNCATGETNCSGHCVDTLSDRDHCGGCGTSCPGAQVCVGGACAAGCPKSETNCSGACVSTATDPSNCGACGTKCDAGQVCSGGKCALTCGPGFTDCSGGDAGAGDGGGAHYCADTTVDRTNCGGCGVVCAAGTKCTAGKCVTSCGGGLTDCSGSCKDLKNDPNDCGACGTTCKPTEVCTAGVCTLSCGGGTTACGGACKDLSSDAANCGACGTACKPSETCRSGTCTGVCASPLTLCSGVCKDLQTDSSNCGACGTVCPAGQVCSAGTCALTCDPSLTTCSGKCVNISIDPLNCGGCGNRCALPHATSGCEGGTCFIAFCDTDYANCNGLPGDGCEVFGGSDPSNCGGCGVVCTKGAHVSTVACTGGACTIGACDAGYFDLNGPADGCECHDLAGSHSCSAPTNEGTVGIGGSASVTSNMPITGRDDYYLVNFASLGSTSVHPRITLTTNPGGNLRFDVLANCAGVALSCGEGGSSTGRTDWEVSYAGPAPPADPSNPGFTPIYGSSGPLALVSSGTVIVRVYRATGAPVCDSYVIKFSD